MTFDLGAALAAQQDGLPLAVDLGGQKVRLYYRPVSGNTSYQAKRSQLIHSWQLDRMKELQELDGARFAELLKGAKADPLQALKALKAKEAVDDEQPEEPGGLSAGDETLLARHQLNRILAVPEGVDLALSREAFAWTVLIGWESEDFTGGLPVTEENAAELMALDPIYQAVNRAATSAEIDSLLDTLQRTLEEAVEGPLSGASGGGSTSRASGATPKPRRKSTKPRSSTRGRSPQKAAGKR